jgi:hypothetical protein
MKAFLLANLPFLPANNNKFSVIDTTSGLPIVTCQPGLNTFLFFHIFKLN